MVEEAGLVLRYTVADLEGGINRGRRALERLEGIELGQRNWVADPREKLLRRDNPS